MAPVTRERILDGATAALARHGLAKLDMGDVSVTSGVSRGTLYRYFPSREVLLGELARREGLRLKQEMLEAVAAVPSGPERVLVALTHATRRLREHPALQRLVDTDPALLLHGLQREFASLKTELRRVLEPMVTDFALVRNGVVTADQLTDWMLRLMISALLFPEGAADDMAHGVTAIYRLLTADDRSRALARRRSAAKPPRKRTPRRPGRRRKPTENPT